MKREIIKTADGSNTIRIEEWNEQYHSVHGAVAEAYHVFINQGLLYLPQENIRILEMGFGTGLNALITYSEAEKSKLTVRYTGVEAFPVSREEWGQLKYPEVLSLDPSTADCYNQMHESAWEEWIALSKTFQLLKLNRDMEYFQSKEEYHLIYFDAFGYRVQPELWSEQVFRNMFNALKDNGVLVTYAAKGVVRRTMEKVGFAVERLPGPPGKREMLRARKPKPSPAPLTDA